MRNTRRLTDATLPHVRRRAALSFLPRMLAEIADSTEVQVQNHQPAAWEK